MLNSEKKQKLYDFIIPVIMLLIASSIFWLSSYDLDFQRLFWSQESGWFLKNSQPWLFIYHYGNIPALLITAAAIFILTFSFRKQIYYKYKKIAIYLILVMAIGPGLITNAVLKSNWDRPRPRNLLEFNGKYNYEKVLSIDTSSKGKSFPCGHATMGFYFFALYFILRKKRRKLATITLIITLIFGMIIGFARILQGGHFLSDVIWAGGIVYFTAATLFYFLKLDKDIFLPGSFNSVTRSMRILSHIIPLLIIFLVIFVLTATPYNKEKTFVTKKYDQSVILSKNYELVLCESELDITFTNDFVLRWSATGFGLPKSKILHNFSESIQDSIYILKYQQKIKGIFNELQQDIKLFLPSDDVLDHNLIINKGNVTILLDEDRSYQIEVTGKAEIKQDGINFDRIKDNVLILGNSPFINLHLHLTEGQITFKKQ